MTYRSIHGTSPSYLQSCFTRVSNMKSRRRLRSSTSHRLDVPPFVSLQSASRRFRFLVPPSGMTCLSTSHLRRHSRFSDNGLKTFLFSRSYQDTIIWLVCYYHHSSPLSGNVTNVYDDDDDDDDDVFVNDVAFVHSIKMRYLNRANKYNRS